MAENNRPVRIGLIGASSVAQYALLAPAATRADIAIVSVAARDPMRAEAYAQQFGIGGFERDYASLIARDDLDFVYVSLPPVEHCRWTIQALEAGRHVLCEKPFAMNATEAQRMVEAGRRNRRMLIEAWHYRHHALMRRVMEIVGSGVLGGLRHLRAQFDAPTNPALDEFRWQARLGGGALMDTGGYTIHALRTIAGREPAVIEARADRYDDIDLSMTARLDFGGGLAGEIDCSLAARGLHSILSIEGERGSLRAEGFPLPQWGCKLEIETERETTVEVPGGPGTYEAQLQHLADLLRGTVAPLTGGDDAIANMRAIDAIYRAAGFERG